MRKRLVPVLIWGTSDTGYAPWGTSDEPLLKPAGDNPVAGMMTVLQRNLAKSTNPGYPPYWMKDASESLNKCLSIKLSMFLNIKLSFKH